MEAQKIATSHYMDSNRISDHPILCFQSHTEMKLLAFIELAMWFRKLVGAESPFVMHSINPEKMSPLSKCEV